MANVIHIITLFFLIIATPFPPPFAAAISTSNGGKKRELIELNGGPDDLVWVVQLSDLHFSVHHPKRAHDFREIVGPTLSFINPSLVLLTGDLTDGKSKDHLTMKQDEKEWIEYQQVMRDVIKRSGLNERIFYDVRGNHDNFGVPILGGKFDYFSKYSVNGKLQRSEKVNSVTIQTSKRKLLFVGFDSTISPGLRGPTNLFGHPTDELLTEISSELSQWDSQTSQPVTKVSYGHFPVSFSASSNSGKTLQDIFQKHSLDVYLCGHLHKKFGNNLKRHHYSNSKKLIQLNGHRTPPKNASNSLKADEFWEWEMGDWRKCRAMRVLAIDRGHMSFIDINFELGSKKTIILPTFPPDSRFTLSSAENYKSVTADPNFYGAVRALVFSASPIVSVLAKIYDTSSKNLIVVMDTPMTKLVGNRGDLYVAPWNIQAFEDPSPERYVLQIEATDIMGRSTVTELRPFSVNGIPAKLRWTWKEFFVMGCQWDSLYYPIISCFYFLMFSILLLPKIFLSLSKRPYTYKKFRASKGFVNGLAWIFTEFYNVRVVWFGMIVYLFYLVLCPWFYGQVFTEGTEWGYMTYRGWVLRLNDVGKVDFIGFPDVMVVVLAHLLVILPAIFAIMVLAAESGVYRDYLLSRLRKKNDDYDGQSKESVSRNNSINGRRWLRNFTLAVLLAICWKHSKNCVALMKAYDMNPMVHFPVYSLAIPMLLAYTVWKTR
ncbi:hypothetical protein ACJIZ3_008660 [Penstemon smallii]|uniref:Calcineurin-like phosphoesterase domain-containing protein n=1 Tax=Penstemon smallii TaxID=265156 RepID=A0ABD3TAF9_9LAMI